MTEDTIVCLRHPTDAARLHSVTVSYVWTVRDFVQLEKRPGQCISSPTFWQNINGYAAKWCIDLYPYGSLRPEARNHLSCFIRLEGSPQPQVQVDYALCILNAQFEERKSVKGTRAFTHSSNDWGHACYIERKDLLSDPDNLVNGNLLIKCQFTYNEDPFLKTRIRANLPPNIASHKKWMEDQMKLFSDGQFTDVIISVNNKQIPAHKAILAARSPVFAAMFKHGTTECETNNVVINDIDEEVLIELLRYMYTGIIQNNNIARKLLPAADKYHLSELVTICAVLLCGQLTAENALETLLIADRHSLGRLKSYTLHFIKRHAAQIVEKGDFMTICPPYLLKDIILHISKG